MNLRPSGYEPDELPDCSTPRRGDEFTTAGRIVKDCKASRPRDTVTSMTTVLIALNIAGAVLALVTGVRALRSWVRYRRTRIELRDHMTEEVASILVRTGELEKNLSALEARSQQLPVQIAELQESLTTLQVLTSALSASLTQLQRALSFSALKTLSAVHLSNLLPSRQTMRNERRPG